MHVYALIVVALLLLAGLVSAMLTYADHLNGHPTGGRHVRHAPGTPEAVPPERRVWDAVVVDPLTAEELALGRLDHGAESFAVQPEIFRTDTEEVARQLWNDGFDWYIDSINERFNALVADLPSTGEDPFDPAYWPQVSAIPTSGLPGADGPPVDLDRLAAFSPEATIQIITDQNATPTYFSWHTQEQPLVGGHGNVQVSQQGTTTLVRERPRRPRHRR